ncbi:Collagen alpha-1(V) chain [Halotydeus destructor]|nr:Collagen alpha-1(V) chain [Halotydeus destructor]
MVSKLTQLAKAAILLAVVAFGNVTSIILPSGSADMLKLVDIDQESLPGVTRVFGICPKRAISQDEDGNPVYATDPNPDMAWKVTSKSSLTISTAQAFPDEFPEDFSILVAVKPDIGSEANLLTIYTSLGKEQLALRIGNNVSLSYRDGQGQGLTAVFGSKVNDGQWHRLALSVHDKKITLLTDCTDEKTRPFKRTSGLLDISGNHPGGPDHAGQPGLPRGHSAAGHCALILRLRMSSAWNTCPTVIRRILMRKKMALTRK